MNAQTSAGNAILQRPAFASTPILAVPRQAEARVLQGVGVAGMRSELKNFAR
jgi:hypothetical protein